jgi:hypothetical protein
LSEAQLSLVRRCASIECELERLDALLSRGEAVDLDEYGRAASHLRRLFETVGLKRVPRNLNPKLDDVILEHAQRAAALSADESEVVDG